MCSAPVDRSHFEYAGYACECGTFYRARRWRWVDASGNAELLRRVRNGGPFDGACPNCGARASGQAPWAEVQSKRAMLILDASRRGEVGLAVADHVRAVRAAFEDEVEAPAVYVGLLSPEVVFGAEELLEQTNPKLNLPAEDPAEDPPNVRVTAGAPARTEQPARIPAARTPDAGEPPRPPVRTVEPEPDLAPSLSVEPAADAGVPQVVGGNEVGAGDEPKPARSRPGSAALIGRLLLAEGTVTLHAEVDEKLRRLWGTAALRARPIHIRDLVYPLLGVRVIASYIGEVSVIDGVIDVGSEDANTILHALSREFRLSLVLHCADASTLARDVEGTGLERNAALCMESARAALASGEFPPENFERAVEELAGRSVDERMREAEVSVGAGDYRYLVSPVESWQALDHLDRVSAPDTLARLLEVDGFPVTEFEAIRRRVLAASVEHGICAPRRFWRRVIDSGLAEDSKDYVKKLINGRLACQRAAAADDDAEDLSDELRTQAWQRIYDYCQAKKLGAPRPVLAALGLRVADQAGSKQGGNPSRMASGVIGGGEAVAAVQQVGRSRAADEAAAKLKDPAKRLPAALDIFRSETDARVYAELFAKLDTFNAEELLGLLPAMCDAKAEVAGEVASGLIAKLMSPSRELRQAAAFVLGHRRAGEALDALTDLLVRERTAAWHDVARAVGDFETDAIEPLRAALGSLTARDRAKVDRLARALAEVAARAGQAPVEALLGESEPERIAAERALAMLAVVERDGRRIRGEEPFESANPAHEFSLRMHEAVGVEEIEAAEVEMVEVTQVVRLEDLEMI